MRIAHVSDCFLPRLGGIEMHVRDLAERQRDAGHEVTVITSTRGENRADGPEIVRVDRGDTKPGRIGYGRSAGVGTLLDAGGYELVHVHPSAFSPLAYLAAHHAARRRIPAVVTVHSLWAGTTPLFRFADRLLRWSEWPAEWTAVSRAAASALREVLAGSAEVTVVPNGVDPDLWQVKPAAGPPDELRIVAVGRLAPRKRTMHLARLLLDAQRRLPSRVRLSIEIIGEGPERRALERYLRHHGMTGWVHLRGALDRDDIRAVFARCDLFVAPAALESFGIAALEARCAGVPVLARAGTGVEDFVRQDREGWLVGSDRAMADLIVSLALDRVRLERVASHNRRVAAGINWALVLERYDRVYRTAAARHGVSWPQSAPALPSSVPVGRR